MLHSPAQTILLDHILLQNSQHSPGLFHAANSLLSFHEERFIMCKIGKGGHDVHRRLLVAMVSYLAGTRRNKYYGILGIIGI
jgi:hypothetical protein